MRRKPDQKIIRTRKPRKSPEEQALDVFHQMQDDICDMYAYGATIDDLVRKFPVFTKEEILSVIQGRYEIDDADLRLIDGSFLRLYQRQFGRLEQFINTSNDPELTLKAIDLQISAIDRTSKYRHIFRPTALSDRYGTDDDATRVTITIEQRIQNKLQQLPPEHKPLFIEDLRSKSSREEIEEILEGEWTPAGSSPKAPAKKKRLPKLIETSNHNKGVSPEQQIIRIFDE